MFYRPELHFVRQKANSKSEIFIIYYLLLLLVTEEEDGSLLLQISFAQQNILYVFIFYICIVVITLVLLRYISCL